MMVAGVVEPERLIFVDECGTHTSLAPIYGYAPRGERLRLSVPRKRGKPTHNFPDIDRFLVATERREVFSFVKPSRRAYTRG